MKIIDARLVGMLDDYGRTYANAPSLLVLVDRIPARDDLVFDHFTVGNRHVHLGVSDDGYAIGYWHDGSPRNLGGLYGAGVEVAMRDGSRRVLAGPWIGSDVNAFGAGEFVHAGFTEQRVGFDKGWPDHSAWLALDVACAAAKLCRPVEGRGMHNFGVSFVAEGVACVDYVPVVVKRNHNDSNVGRVYR